MYKFINNVIDKLLKLPKAVVFVLLAASFIYANIFGNIPVLSPFITALISMIGIKYIWANAIIFGLLAWGLFELIAAVYFWIVKSMMGAAEIYKNKPAMAGILRWFFIIRNIIFGSVRLLYFRHPLAVLTVENILLFALSLATLIIYYFIIRKKYIEPQAYPRSLMAFCAPYLVYLVVNIFTGALL